MTSEEARARIAIHSGSAEGFTAGYVYALRYGFCDNLEDVQQKFDEIFMCLKVLKKSSCFLDKELIRDLSQILWQSILYINKQLSKPLVTIKDCPKSPLNFDGTLTLPFTSTLCLYSPSNI